MCVCVCVGGGGGACDEGQLCLYRISCGHQLVCVCVCMCMWGGGSFPNCHVVHKDLVIKVGCVSIGSVVVIS